MKIVNFGSLNIDYVFHVDKIVQPGQTIDSLGEERFPGGKGLNQSLAMARAGAKVYHAGLIGEDGQFLRELLEGDGVDCRYLKTIPSNSGRTFIQVDAAGQNSIVLSGGANRANSTAFCDQVLAGFQAGDVLLVQNEINCVDYLIDRAYDKGMLVVFNPSPMNEAVLRCDLNKVSIFIMNEDEGARITGKTRPEDILAQMEARYPEAQVVQTLGSQGSVYAYRGRRVFQPAFSVQTVDTTGAGDTFTGYYLAGMAQGLPTEENMRRAALAAAIAVTRSGAASSIPWSKELAENP